jgi:hypothetical protein
MTVTEVTLVQELQKFFCSRPSRDLRGCQKQQFIMSSILPVHQDGELKPLPALKNYSMKA